MKTLIKALAVVCIAAIVVFAALRLAGTLEEVAKSISVLVLGSITYVHKTLEKDKKQSGFSFNTNRNCRPRRLQTALGAAHDLFRHHSICSP